MHLLSDTNSPFEIYQKGFKIHPISQLFRRSCHLFFVATNFFAEIGFLEHICNLHLFINIHHPLIPFPIHPPFNSTAPPHIDIAAAPQTLQRWNRFSNVLPPRTWHPVQYQYIFNNCLVLVEGEEGGSVAEYFDYITKKKFESTVFVSLLHIKDERE